MNESRLAHRPRIVVPQGLQGVEVHSGRGREGDAKQLFHEEYLFLLLAGTTAMLELGSDSDLVPDRRLIMIAPEAEGCCTAIRDHRYLALLLHPDLTAAPDGEVPGVRLALKERWAAQPEAAEAFVRLCEVLDSLEADEAERGREAIDTFLALLVEIGLAARSAGDERGSPVLRRAREHVRSSFTRGLPLDELSIRTGMCKFALVRAFKREFGLPPHAYQTHLRVNLARALIRQGVPIAHAALQAGFSDQSHLNRHFKRRLGFTPGQYAKQVVRRRKGTATRADPLPVPG
jgi:AraC-like DNA-binding protein